MMNLKLSIYFLLLGLPVIPCVSYAQDEFHRRKGNITSIEIQLYDSSLTSKTYDVKIISDREDTILGRIREPVPQDRVYPVAFLVVGIETGKNVIDMIEGYDSVIVFGIDYPLKGSIDFSGWESIKTAFALRSAGFKTIRQIHICLDWLSALRIVDTTDISIVAVSFGVFTGVPAAALDQRVDKLVVVQGGGDLFTVLSANAERLGFPLPSWIAGWVGNIILSPFEPNDYIEQVSPRPLMIFSSESDLLFPHSSVQSLYDHAKEPKEWIKHKSSHVAPDEEELIRELTRIVGEKIYRRK